MTSHRLKAALVVIAMLGGIGGLLLVFGQQFTRDAPSLELATQNLQPVQNASFRSEQLNHANVQLAVAGKEAMLRKAFVGRGISWPATGLALQVLKDRGVLEVRGAGPSGDATVLRAFRLCTGPDGTNAPRPLDALVEGAYHIDRFFPRDLEYQLAVSVAGPVDAPPPKGATGTRKARKGGAPDPLLIRGGCAASGHLHVGDEGMQELYVLLMEATSAGQKEIPVRILSGAPTPAAGASP